MRSSTRMLVAVAAAVIAASSARAEKEYDMAHTRPLASGNGSDPFFIPCVNPYNGLNGYCLYTSQDMGYAPANTSETNGSGGFMMGYTRVLFSTDGVSWQDEGIVADESQLGSWVKTKNNFHFWAPCVYTEQNGYSYTYRLYVPDVPVGDQGQFHFNGQLHEFTSTVPFGQFTYVGIVSRATHHMSDPEVFPKGTDTSATQGKRYMLWADGDGATCGGLSIGEMSDDLNVITRSDYRIQFSNIGDMKKELGTCTMNGGISVPKGYDVKPFDGPYLEGPSLYDLARELPALKITAKDGNPRNYMLVFPAKPYNGIPTLCRDQANSVGEGEPNSDNQVLAYALSNDVMGPYEYQGILMCGTKNDFTNHMNLAQLTTPSGSGRPVVYYHDSTGNHDRKLLAECVYAVDRPDGHGKQLAVIDRDTRDGLSWCTGNTPVFALKTSSGRYVQANSNDGGNLNSKGLRIGAWEQFTSTPLLKKNPQDPNEPQYWGIQARSTRQYFSANLDGDGRMSASRAAIRDWEKFKITNYGADSVVLSIMKNGKETFVRVNGNDPYALIADQGSSSSAEKFKMVFLWDN